MATMKEIQKIYNLRYSPVPFECRTMALGFANRNRESGSKFWMVILGDDCKFWVVVPADASRLVRHGYEYAR